MSDPPVLIALDWGTTSFRAYLIARSGRIADRIERPSGILNVPDCDFDRVFNEAAGPWIAQHGALPAVAAGMIGSRQGWVEAPYVSCPAGLEDLAHALVPHTARNGCRLWFVPGVMRNDDDVHDVMRGEETQIVGALGGSSATAQATFVLPGTHSKWVLVENGRIVWFATFMTGEVFAVLAAHSILGRLMAGESEDVAAFRRGIDYAASAGHGGLLKKLFSTRTLGLFEQVPATALRSYLSGLVIGTEIDEALACLAARAGSTKPATITLVGTQSLGKLYVTALATRGLATQYGEAHAAARGLALVAAAAELVPAR